MATRWPTGQCSRMDVPRRCSCLQAGLWPDWLNNKDSIRRAYEKTVKRLAVNRAVKRLELLVVVDSDGFITGQPFSPKSMASPLSLEQLSIQ